MNGTACLGVLSATASTSTLSASDSCSSTGSSGVAGSESSRLTLPNSCDIATVSPEASAIDCIEQEEDGCSKHSPQLKTAKATLDYE